MSALTEPVKIAIVQGLACLDTPTQVVAHLKNEFGLLVPRQQVASYDPTKATGAKLSQKLRAIFHATRKQFLADVSTIPISQQAYRLRVLQRNLERADQRGNAAIVTSILEQAAKELGGAFTNRRELTGKNGQPLAVATSNVTPEELKEVVENIRDKF